MILVLCGSIAAGCAIITLAYGAEKILERAVKPPKRRKRAARPGAEVVDLGKIRITVLEEMPEEAKANETV